MKAAPHPPAAQPLAGLLADMRLESARLAAQRGMLVVLHTLILTTLIRLFGRLDHMMSLWQSGQLPSQSVILSNAKDPRFPPVPPQSAPAPCPLPRPSRRVPHPAIPHADPNPRAEPSAVPAQLVPTRLALTCADTFAPPAAHHHPRFRKPPWLLSSNEPEIPTPNHAKNITISKQNACCTPTATPLASPHAQSRHLAPLAILVSLVHPGGLGLRA